MRNQPKNIANVRNATNKIARGIMNTRIRFVKKLIQISINKLRDREQIIPKLIHKSDIIQGEVVIYLDDAVPSTLPLFLFPKVTYSLCDRVMCCEQPESMSHVFFKPPSITYIR
jgi:hypothetical protein